MKPQSREPNLTTKLPSGNRVDYYDSIGVDGKPQKRRYLLDGHPTVSVSTLAGMMPKDLTGWAYNVGLEAGLKAYELGARDVAAAKLCAREQKLDVRSVTSSASERGTAVHATAEELLREKQSTPWLTVELESQASGYEKAAVDFINKCVISVDLIEVVVASPSLLVAGRLDAVCELKDSKGRPFRSVVDFKTTDKEGDFGLYNSHIAQLSGYSLCLKESGYEPANKATIVRLHKSGEFTTHTFTVKHSIFKTCAKLHEADRHAQKIAKQTASLTSE